MSIEKKRLVCLIAAGDAKIIASRTMPFPHSYCLNYPGGAAEVSEDQIVELVAAKMITPKPQDELWDTIYYLPESATARAAAIEYYPNGFGRCECCDEIVGLTPKGKLYSHGPRKDLDGAKVPACEGSGKDPVLPVKAAA